MQRSLFVPIGLALAGLVGCGSRKGPESRQVTTVQARTAPSWTDNEEIPDGLGAVGIAQANPMDDKSFQRTTAIADARTKLAGKIRVRVQNLFSQLNQQIASAAQDGARKPVRGDLMNRVAENVTRQVVDQDLAGTTVRSFWQDPSDATLYVFVVMTRETLDRALAGAAQGQLRREIAQGEQSLDKALVKLDAAIAASEPGAQH
jgi:hypothetical protein